MLSIHQPFILAGLICMKISFSAQHNITLPLRERPLFTLYFHFTLVLRAYKQKLKMDLAQFICHIGKVLGAADSAFVLEKL